jgi:NAD(P)-dependent dehydrogenase (short-subunit alcohol dehydrogenase family)
MKFDGKVALITGGGTGIGKSAALALAWEGAKVVIVGRRSGPLEETAQEIKAINGEVLAVPTDVTVIATFFWPVLPWYIGSAMWVAILISL